MNINRGYAPVSFGRAPNLKEATAIREAQREAREAIQKEAQDLGKKVAEEGLSPIDVVKYVAGNFKEGIAKMSGKI